MCISNDSCNTLEIKMIPVLYEVTGQTGGENRESKDFPTHSVKDINDKGLLLCFVHLKLKTKKKKISLFKLSEDGSRAQMVSQIRSPGPGHPHTGGKVHGRAQG